MSLDAKLARIVLFYSKKRFKLEIRRVENRSQISYSVYYFLKNKNLLQNLFLKKIYFMSAFVFPTKYVFVPLYLFIFILKH